MRQGSASRDGAYGRKREPIAKAIDLEAVGQIGIAMGNKATGKSRELNAGIKPNIYSGRGYEAPKASLTSHEGGTQRRYK